MVVRYLDLLVSQILLSGLLLVLPHHFSGRDLPKRGTLGGDNFPMSNLGSGWVKGDPLITFLFRFRFSSALRDGIGVFNPMNEVLTKKKTNAIKNLVAR